MATYYGEDGAASGGRGTAYVLTDQIAHGAEGSVYSIKDKPGYVAKIYTQARYDAVTNRREGRSDGRAFMHAKLKEMVRLSKTIASQKWTTIRGHSFLAWPVDTLVDASGQFCGYVMPRVKGKGNLYAAVDEYAHDDFFGPGKYTWKTSITIAKQMAYVVGKLHENGIVIGDFNPQNFMLDSDGFVSFCDIDSYTITNDYKTLVAFPGLVAPELQGKPWSSRRADCQFTEKSDDFSLGCLIFQLLTGKHPFNAVVMKPGMASVSQSSTELNIANGYCLYVRPGLAQRPIDAPDVFGLLFPDYLRDLCEKCFNYTDANAIKPERINQRPSAAEWYYALERLEKSRKKRCRTNRQHYYLPGVGTSGDRRCPWCEREERLNPTPGGKTGTNTGTKIGTSTSTVRPATTDGPLSTAIKWFLRAAAVLLLLMVGVDYVTYESRLFDPSVVHTIDIRYDDWATFLCRRTDNEYANVDLTIDSDRFPGVALCTKDNASLANGRQANSVRCGFEVEFDHYDASEKYYGLDKCYLYNIVQDSTYMKDYLAQRMMAEFGVDAPLCSFVWITVNGEPWGLYLAVEAVEESFIRRNYGLDGGNLYQPDGSSLVIGSGEDQGFDTTAFLEAIGVSQEEIDALIARSAEEGQDTGDYSASADGGASLVYTDDEIGSYRDIFQTAQRPLSARDIANVINGLRKLGNQEDLEEVLDTDEVLRYLVVHNFTQNGDSYTGLVLMNYYLYVEADGTMHMIPWDYNLAYGALTAANRNASYSVNAPIDAATLTADIDPSRPMSNWVFESEEYTEAYNELYRQFVDELDIPGIVEEAYELIRGYVLDDPTAFYTIDEFDTGVYTLFEYCYCRTESIKGQLDGSIGKTNAEQAVNGGYVDASHIGINDMGSYDNTGSNNPVISYATLYYGSES